ncbi:hypothetical protein I2W78_19860 [Streptomyces spinoverrucosus]|uniref:NHL domain-containing protein n=1 Tax=Streptomyces spinoverrucosus TaxID=284043 RepID=UPI0018C3BC64|nr:hypothetical protein [Streptomyces spinoverrucosus]MBG0854040.1 hypothetical protein [Streptomyces spinoverrucosus]
MTTTISRTALQYETKSANTLWTFAGGGTATVAPYGDGHKCTDAVLSWPHGLAVAPSGDVYIADNLHGKVRKVDPQGEITTVLGGGAAKTNGGSEALSTLLSGPNGLALDGEGNLYVADVGHQRILRVNATQGTIGESATFDVIAGDGHANVTLALNWETGLAVDRNGDLYFSDPDRHLVYKFDKSREELSVVAGSTSATDQADGVQATGTLLSFPAGLAFDGNGDLYIADLGHNRVRRVEMSTGRIHAFAGDPGGGNAADGVQPKAAKLSWPCALAIDTAGNVFIADYLNHAVRVVSVKDKRVHTVAGTPPTPEYKGDGAKGRAAYLHGPCALALDDAGNLYIADKFNNRVRALIKAADMGMKHGNDTNVVVPKGADLYGEAVNPGTVHSGEVIRLGVMVRNRGPQTAEGKEVTVTLQLPPGLECADDRSQQCTRNFPDKKLLPYTDALYGVFDVRATGTAAGPVTAMVAISYVNETHPRDNTLALPLTVVATNGGGTNNGKTTVQAADETALFLKQSGMPMNHDIEAINIGMSPIPGQPVRADNVEQVFHAPTGWKFTGQVDASYGRVLQQDPMPTEPPWAINGKLADEGRTMTFRSNLHAFTSASDRGSIQYVLHVRPDGSKSSAGVYEDGSARIGKGEQIKLRGLVS